MFTGIVEETGSVVAFTKESAAWRLQISASIVLNGIALGDSIAVNGCCLTVAHFDDSTLWFDVLEETRRLTNFSTLASGALVNLERSLRFDGKVGGHFVSGHVDGLGTIEAFELRGRDYYLRVRGPAGGGRYLLHKGSISIDGISLTIAETTADTLAVWLIPHTLQVTNLRQRKVGELVNLEFDLLGKYVEKLMSLELRHDGRMNIALAAITEELRRLKAAGATSVSISDATMAALHKAVKSRAALAPQAPLPPKASAPTRTAIAAPTAEAPRPAPAAPVKKAPAEPVEAFPAPESFTLPAGSKSDRMAALRERVLNDPVCRARVRPGKKIVVGVGSLDARIMFVGEAPGAEEELQGEPFVGPAGQLLTKMIGAMGLQRSDVYIGNIMNWRPEMPLDATGVQYGNRPPTEGELRYCLPYLRAQIEIVNPELLVALGTTAAQGLLGYGSFKALGEVRGRWTEFAGKPLMITYHPSYILRNQSNRSKRMIWDDLLQVMERAALPISDKQRAFF